MPKNEGQPSKLSVLRESPLLECLYETQLLDVSEKARVVSVARGDLIWTARSNQKYFGVVVSGFVKMMRSTAVGHDVTTELMGPCQVFGLLGAIDGTGCPQTAQAVCNVQYLRIDRDSFMKVYDSNIILKDRLLKRTTQRLRGSYDLFAIMSTGKVEQRIAAILLILCESYGDVTASGTELRVPLTRQDISEMAGTTVESTIRTLSKWQRAGLVITQNQRVTVTDPPKLQKLISVA